MRVLLLLAISFTLWGQDLSKLSAKQLRVYNELTQSVSTPCCNNAIPVAFHESGWALHVRDVVYEGLLEGKSKAELWKDLLAMTFGEEKQEIIVIVPQKNWLGMIYWAMPVLLFLMGVAAIPFFKKRRAAPLPENQELIDRYQPIILERLKNYL